MLPLLQYWLISRDFNALQISGSDESDVESRVKWNFHRICKKLLPTKASPIASLNLSIIHSSLSKNMTYIRLWAKIWHRKLLGTKPHVPNLILCKAAGLYQWPVWGKGVCSDSNWPAQLLQMAARESLETMSGAILNRLQPKFAAKSVANKMPCLKAIKLPALTGQASIFDLKIFLAIFLCKHSSTVLLTNHP